MTGALLDLFEPGRSIYLPGASGEVTALAEALAAEPGRMRGVAVTSCLIPGINGFDYAALDDEARVTTFLLPPALRPSFAAGRVRVLPIAYSAIARYLAACPPFDVAIAHVAPAGTGGRHSLGVASDFTPIAWANARRRVAIVNPAMPAMRRGPSIAPDEADLVVTLDSPLVEVAATPVSGALATIAAGAAALVPDGAAIQVGIGGAPSAMWAALAGHRGLTIASGLVADGVRLLDEAGALAEGGHRTGVALGSRALYDWLAASDRVELATTRETHDVATLAAMSRFTAINSAIEVDLFGQVNLEWQGGRLVSGVGGAPDFARAAALSAGGRSMTLLPATAKRGAVSRIVPRLAAPSVSIPRGDTDTVLTEFGVAELKHLSQDERAAALIAIAAPEHRASLAAAWHAMRQSFLGRE